MSMLGFSTTNTSHSSSSSNNMSRPSFFNFKKQASFYIKEKIKTARLALTDVTPAQLLTEEATNANPWAPDARTLGLISRAAFEVDDYWRIVEILHNKLSTFDRKNWRVPYNALIVVEYLLTHGPESVAKEFQIDIPIIKSMENVQHVDEKGFNWGLAVRKKSERIQKLLEKGPLLKEERDHARKLSREIKGFGSFTGRSTTPHNLKESSTAYGRSHSQFNEHGNDENVSELNPNNQPPLIVLDDNIMTEKPRIMKTSTKENMAPRNDASRRDFHVWDNDDDIEEGDSLLCETNVGLLEEEDHPFKNTEKHSRVSLLAAEIEV